MQLITNRLDPAEERIEGVNNKTQEILQSDIIKKENEQTKKIKSFITIFLQQLWNINKRPNLRIYKLEVT